MAIKVFIGKNDFRIIRTTGYLEPNILDTFEAGRIYRMASSHYIFVKYFTRAYGVLIERYILPKVKSKINSRSGRMKSRLRVIKKADANMLGYIFYFPFTKYEDILWGYMKANLKGMIARATAVGLTALEESGFKIRRA